MQTQRAAIESITDATLEDVYGPLRRELQKILSPSSIAAEETSPETAASMAATSSSLGAGVDSSASATGGDGEASGAATDAQAPPTTTTTTTTMSDSNIGTLGDGDEAAPKVEEKVIMSQIEQYRLRQEQRER